MKRSSKTGLSKISPSGQRGTVSARLPSDYSPPNPIRGTSEEFDLADLVDYQLTVRPKVELTRYQISMLLEILSYEVLKKGIDFVTWILMEYLFTRLCGSKAPEEVRDTKERRVILIANLILLSNEGNWFNIRERETIDPEVLQYLVENDLLPSERTIRSREDYWKPERFIEVRAVRLDVFLERERSTSPYSSYCKGYGESSSMGRRQKTKTSFELDGDDEERPQTVIPLLEIPSYLFLEIKKISKQIRKRRKA